MELKRDVGYEAAVLLVGATSDSPDMRRLTLARIDWYALRAACCENFADKTVLALLANRLVGPGDDD